RGRLERGRERLRKRLTRRGIEIPVVLFGVGLSSSLVEAAVPHTLTAATVQAAFSIASGQTATNVLISTKVCALMEGFVLTKLKTAAAVLAVIFMAASTSLGLGFMLQAGAEPATPNPPAVRPLLHANDPTPPKPRVDEAGDPLPAGAVARLGTERFRMDAW